MNKFCNIVFISTLFFVCSCSNLDKTSDLGKNIVQKKAPDNMDPGVYKTILLSQTADSYRSVSDALSGFHIYDDYLQNGGKPPSQWAIGNWENEETILKLSYFVDPSDTSLRLHRILYDLACSSAVNKESIRADLVWTNTTGYNSYDEVGVEVGMLLKYSAPSTKVDSKELFPLNFVAVNPKSLTNSVPLTIESYLMKGKWPKAGDVKDSVTDSTIVHRYSADWTNFVDTIIIDSIFKTTTAGKNYSKAEVNQTTLRMSKENGRKTWQTDTIISWKHFIGTFFYDSADIKKDDNNTDTRISQTITLLKKDKDVYRNAGNIIHTRTTVKDNASGYGGSVYDTIIFNIIDTMFYRTDRSVKVNKHSAIDWDSVIYNKKFVNARDDGTGKIIPDTLLQSGTSYILPLDKVPSTRGLRAVGGKNNLGDFMYTYEQPEESKQFKDTLSIYLRIDKNSCQQNNVLHVSSPAIRISYKKISDTSRIYINIPFKEKSVISYSQDNLDDAIPVISGGLQRLAKIDLNLSDFWKEINEERYLTIGAANLTLPLDSRTDFPFQYGDSIPIYVIADTANMTPQELFSLSGKRRINSAHIRRDSMSITIPLASTLMDCLYDYKIYEKDAPPHTYLYLWLDDRRMGRIYFKQENAVDFTYILQTRKGG
ncbi:MAG: hypothetical protein LBH98_02540 [Chitinispirillales bacterium]|nr:hypothetical protein [Chitinispirillales bacterium]